MLKTRGILLKSDHFKINKNVLNKIDGYLISIKIFYIILCIINSKDIYVIAKIMHYKLYII